MPANPNSPAPVTPINEWACGLAALNWNLIKIGQPFNQDTIVSLLGANFPLWNLYKGMMEFEEIFSALKHLRVSYQKLILTNSKKEVLDFVGANLANYKMGFVKTRKPTAHIMAVESWTGDVATLADGGRPNAQFVDVKWDDLVAQQDASFLFLFD